MNHVLRALLVLVNIILLLVGVIVALKITGEEVYPGMVDKILGVHGVYGITGESKELMNRPVFSESTYCVECHLDVNTSIDRDHHGFDCQTCHGPLGNHPDSDMVLDRSSIFCLSCHRDVTGRDETIVRTVGEEHGDGKECVECHHPHKPYDCSTCHSDVYNKILAGKHGIDCESCHGELGDHPKSPAPEIRNPDSLCLKCHRLNMPESHKPDWKCMTCHDPHYPMRLIKG